MDTVGVVCEFDPLHRGHEALLRRAGESGRPVVCAMSGNFTQRGGAACVEKFARAEMAVRCGADLVAELPTPWAMATAEIFAGGGVALLAACGVSRLYFGSECGDIDALQAAAEGLMQPEIHRAIREEMRGGRSYAAARQAALAASIGPGAAVLAQPNNTLGVEYLKAIRRQGLSMDAATLRREDGGHHGAASASRLRALLAEGNSEEALLRMPPAAADILRREIGNGTAPAEPNRLERAMLARLRLMNEEDFAAYDGGGEGLYRRVYRTVQQSGSVEEILAHATTRRYPTARVRRMLWAAFLQLEQPESAPPYVRILAATAEGRRLLRQLQDSGAPVLTKAADVGRLGPAAERLFTREARRTDVYALAGPDSPPACGSDWRRTPLMV